MILEQDFEDFVSLLSKYNVAYMVVGGYALALHGKPRHTGDLDIWIEVSQDNAAKVVKVLKEFGMESLGLVEEDFLKPGFISQIGYPPLRIDILNSIDGVTFSEASMGMQKIQLEDDLVLNYIGLDDFLVNKQASGRKQDLADIKEIQKLQSGQRTRKK
ncbi:nucleotidyltransferase [Daejeonella sp.]|uniref:nucleotidyltransferase n=1 Tax=Daejeonella sp. TaxID=2805397 RepID=UPI003983BEEC